jgi:hypothetical protein
VVPGEQVVEEARVQVEAVVEVAAIEHVCRVRYEEALVELRPVPQPPADAGEPEHRGDRQEADQGEMTAHAGYWRRGR